MRKPLMVLWAFYLFLLLQDCSSTNIDNDLTFEDAPARPEAPGRPGSGDGFSLTRNIVNFAKRVKRDLFDWFGSGSTASSSTETESIKETSRPPRSTDSILERVDETRTTPDGDSRSSTVTRRQTRPTDDEDELGSHGGSGEETLVGSGLNEAIRSSEAPRTTLPPSRYDSLNIYVLYRMIVFVEEFMRPALADTESAEFKSFAKNFTADLDHFLNEDSFGKIPGSQQSSVINISPASGQGFIRVTVDIGSTGYDDVNEIRSRIRRQVEDKGRLGLGWHTLRIDSDHPFSLQKFTESSAVECSPGELPCTDGVTCVPVEARCNGNTDCPDGSDEIGCGWSVPSTARTTTEELTPIITDEQQPPVSRSQTSFPAGEPAASRTADRCRADDKVRCPDGSTLICSDQKCDGVDDCPGESEESDCPSPVQPPSDCLDSEFMCDVSRCIPKSQYCDGVVQCTDSTDELECPAKDCHQTDFVCRRGAGCIRHYQRCNGVSDCPLGEDEESCYYGTKRPKIGCGQDFTCDNNMCIGHERRCDRVFDCPDMSDEIGCPTCSISQWTCLDGTCIEAIERCDGTSQCPDSSDEENCPTLICPSEKFSCDNGTKCLEMTVVCDYHLQCVDLTDEPFNCSCDGRFRCNNTYCIPNQFFCDGTRHCQDGSDEPTNCSEIINRCPSDSFRCDDGSCLTPSQVCDHIPDCSTGEDENNCPEMVCLENEFRCNNSECIKNGFVCDGFNDCRDNSDEQDCPAKDRCRDTDFRCSDNVQCVRDFNRCDGSADCTDGSDEQNCGPCRSDEFECRDGKCIDLRRKCDRVNDCGDYSDEADCNDSPPPSPPPLPTSPTPRPPWQYNCSPYQFACRSGNECVSKGATCDGRWDCQDGSDEENCIGTPTIRLVTTPTNQTIEESREVVFQCRDEGLGRHRVRWTRLNGAMPPRSRDLGNRLEMPNIQRSHSGAYVCEVIDVPPNTPGARATVYLQVVPFLTPSSPPIAPGCSYDEATCYNRQCIPRNKVCDGFIDCTDGSDESRCAKHSLCEPNMFACDDKECIYKMWRCDGQNDCLDGSDERGCPQVRNGTCLTSEFACKTNNQCVPRGMRCDKTSDCIDGSDEVGCRQPVIVQPPPSILSLEIGSTLRVECTASGDPIPEISWRLNWRHVAPKCTSFSEGGRGILTCPDLTKEDEGAYSCEALGMGRPVFARPDLHLTIGTDRPQCPRGQFNEGSSNISCTPCFCFGHTRECTSANLHAYKLPPPQRTFRLAQVATEPDIRIISEETSPVQNYVQPVGNNGFQILAPSGGDTGRYQYFSMPESTHLNNQLNSYGGYINYQVTPSGESSGRRRFLDIPDIILEGNGRILTYKWRYPFVRDRANSVSVRIYPEGWMVSVPSRNINKPATRVDIMTALANVDALLIRVQYFEGPEINTIISDITMDTARPIPTGLAKVTSVEQCVCPAGYTGLSCERCADNYVQQTGEYLHKCEIPPCREGFYGAPDRGIPCRQCACPYLSPVRSCRLDSDDLPTCDCPFGYSGRRCENPPADTCSEAGSRYVSDNGTCDCKDYTTGPSCDSCAPNTFHLSASNQHGCIKCFCFGQTEECDSSSLYRDKVQLRSFADRYGVVLAKRDDLTNVITPEVDPSTSELYFDQFDSRDQDAHYWVLPRMFLDNKVTSYGGNLVYRIRYTPTPGGQSSKNNAPDVKIVSDKLSVERFHYTSQVIEPDRDVTVTVPLFEQHWQSADGAVCDREHLMMALADVSAILIKATYTTGTQKAALISVSLDTATSRNTGQPRALEVEQCRCPPGYVGTSCENCATGFKYSGDGTYKGICESCQCNGASEDCDPESGVCRNCREGRVGDFCERCPDDYTLTPEGCKREGGGQCYCDPRGSQSEECRDNRCICKTYVEGDQCDRCAPGYFHLSEDNPVGCSQCYCSGVSSTCRSSNFNMENVPHFIIDSNHNLSLSDGSRIVERDSFTVNSAMSEVGYTLDGRHPRLFWSLPSSFTGDKIHSYSGSLQFSQRFTSRNSNAVSTRDNDVIITGGGISIYYNMDQPLQAGQVRASSVPLKEGKWRRLDPRTSQSLASRSEILRILSKVESILVRATLTPEADETFIRDISMGVASPDVTGPRADEVEVCDCPDGYTGSSCQNCARNHYKNYDGSCLKCPCVHNEECHLDSSTNRVKCDCSSRYVGDNCESEASRPYPSPPSPVPIRVIVDIQPQGIIPEGDTVVLTCSGDSYGERTVRLTWSRRDGRLPQQHVLDNIGGRLTIYNVHPSDSGVYVCTATDGITSETQYSTLNIGAPAQPPSVRIVPSTVEIMEGEAVTITCEASGSPEPQIEWKRLDGRPLSRSVRVRDKTLRIYPASRSADEGSYECVARNEGGESRERVTVVILERSTPVPQIRIQPAYLNASEGQSVTITCQVQSPTSQFRLEWIRERRLPMPSHVVARGGELVFDNIRSTDSGVYICVVTSIQTGRKVGEGSANILVSRIGRPPILSIYPERQTLEEGETAVLTCTGLPSGQPANWYRSGSQLPEKARISAGELIIPNIDESDQAVYNCEVITDRYRARATAFIEVRRRGVVPTITIQPNSTVDLNEGESWHVQCRTEGDPRPTVHWERKGSSDFPRNVIRQNPGVLRFERVTLAESDDYTCVAENSAGRTSAVLRVTVMRKPRVRINPRGQISAVVGQRLELFCQATGVPAPTVTWHINTRYSQVLPSERTEPGSAVHRIMRVSQEDEGTYECTATNPAGEERDSVFVIVNDSDGGGGGPPQETEEFEVDVGGSSEIRCSLPSENDLSVEWRRGDGRTLGRNVVPYDDRLVITNAQELDSGDYVCLYKDSKGVARKTATARLRVVERLRIQLSPPRQTVAPGDSPLIRCVVEGDSNAEVRWDAAGRSMPISAEIRGETIQFRNIQEADAGRYTCTAIGSGGFRAESTAEVVVKRGIICPGFLCKNGHCIKMIYRCDGTFHCNDKSDEENCPSKKRAISKASNIKKWSTITGGKGSPPTGQNFAVKFVGEKEINKTEGSAILLQCSYNLPANVTWIKREGSLPPYSTQDEKGDLKIVNLRPEDSGTYLCKGRSQWGLTSSDTVRLNIIPNYESYQTSQEEGCEWGMIPCGNGQCISKQLYCDGNFDCPDGSDEVMCPRRKRNGAQNIRVFIEPSIDVIRVGDNVDLRCNSVGVFDSESSRKWEKVGGALADNVQILDSTLRIRDVTSENAGVYRCWARKQNRQIVEDSFTLEVQGNSQQSYIQRKAAKTQYAKAHESIALQCDQGLEQPVRFSWTKNGQPLPNNTGDTIPFADVLPEDAGYYMCVAYNGEIKIEFPTFLVVRGSIPRFRQRSSSYLKLRSMHSAYLKFNIHVTIKPDQPNGLILYNGGEKGPTTKDFVSLGLKNGYVELRFDVGSGEAVIISNVSVPMGKWSNITIRRERKEGRLWVNNRGPFIGTSPGRYQGLDLTEPLYLGSVPDYSAISSAAGFTTGFVGCISYLKINDEVETLSKPLESSDVGDCDTCAEQSECRNNGVCQEATNEKGYSCLCPRGFKGDYCEQTGGACYAGLCNDGRCEDVDSSYKCHCKLGKSGDNCERNLEVTVPAFHGKSYLAYPIPHIATDFSIGLDIVRHDERDGLLAYAAQYATGGGDFISLTIKGNYAEFMVDTGSGTAIVRNPEFIKKNEKTSIVATHSAEDITLTVNGRTTRRPLELRRKKGLNLNTALYIGGSAPWVLNINPMVGIVTGFNGCILSLALNGSPRNMLKNSIDSINIGECYEFSTRSGGGAEKEAGSSGGPGTRVDEGIEGRPRGDLTSERERGDEETGCPVERCQNGGKCDYTMGTPVCLCMTDFGGPYCQIKTNMCGLDNNPCGSTGICVKDTLESYKCECLFGYTGKNCELETHITNNAKFSENAYVELPSSLFTHLDPAKEETISFTFKTDNGEGLIFWQGTDTDYILIGMKNGRLQAEISAGDVPVEVLSTERLDDSKPHRVLLKKKGVELRVTVDDKTLASVDDSMPMRKLEADINWGGASDPWTVTNGRYSKGFEGCLIELRFNDGPPIDLSQSQTFSRNVEHCSSDLDEEYINNEA